MKIIDWTRIIKSFQNGANKENSLAIIRDDFNAIRENLFHGHKVIVRIAEGLRLEVRFIYEIGQLDIKKISRDFNLIREYNQRAQQAQELIEKMRETLKDDREALEDFNAYIDQKMNQPLFELNVVRENKVYKSISSIPYEIVIAYIEGLVESFFEILRAPNNQENI